jgi:hypothetical protein
MGATGGKPANSSTLNGNQLSYNDPNNPFGYKGQVGCLSDTGGPVRKGVGKTLIKYEAVILSKDGHGRWFFCLQHSQ